MKRLFRADLHIHSRYSRATSKKLTPRNLAAWAKIKGINVLGTGDLTHAKWRGELRESLVLDEASGLYQLASTKGLEEEVPSMAFRNDGVSPLFMLQGEISSIYKRGGKVRKVHNLVFMPDFDAAERFSKRLQVIGNLESDGRPIIGLDSKDLLEMVLETAPGAFLIPAHIWTPWFAMFGSKSGFNSVEECFGDLSEEIFALETGLSSDPEMNRLWSALDKYKLVSNSDAHSGEKLGREVNLFSGTASYQGIYNALKSSDPYCQFWGTLEFFPEEGKYHLDGHRACNVVLEPEESRKLGGICPVCHKPLTLGVLYRVEELADRKEPKFRKDEQYASLIPLTELIGEVLSVGPQSRKVMTFYEDVLSRFGSELDVLQTIDTQEVSRFFSPLGEALTRMREGRVIREGGFDGEFGKVKVFAPDELRDLRYGSLISVPAACGKRKKKTVATASSEDEAEDEGGACSQNSFGSLLVGNRGVQEKHIEYAVKKTGIPVAFHESLDSLSAEQKKAVLSGVEPTLVIAGPGSGKTRTLVERVLHLIRKNVPADNILALTFTRRAAKELEKRVAQALDGGRKPPRTETLHSLALSLWSNLREKSPILLDEDASLRVFCKANPEYTLKTGSRVFEQISFLRETRALFPLYLLRLLDSYSVCKQHYGLLDYTDLLEFLLEERDAGTFVPFWGSVLVDEIQDLSPLQLFTILALLPPSGEGFFGIGDPDQSIYGFRGAHGDVLSFFQKTWPNLRCISLVGNYRSAAPIVDLASQFLKEQSQCGELEAMRGIPSQIVSFAALSAESEAIWVAEKIQSLLGKGSATLQGGSKKHSLPLLAEELSPGDIAILVRTRSVIPFLQKALERQGITVFIPSASGFWQDERVKLILEEAGGLLWGKEEQSLFDLSILQNGPKAVAAAYTQSAPFDTLFWESSVFFALCKAYATHNGWPGLLAWIHAQNELEKVRLRGEQVQILTVHASKGLEFKAVFLPCLEEGLFPFFGAGSFVKGNNANELSADLIQEERRLFYVALTRAEQLLFLSSAQKRTLYGKELALLPSRFLSDISYDNITRFTLVKKKVHKAQQLSLF